MLTITPRHMYAKKEKKEKPICILSHWRIKSSEVAHWFKQLIKGFEVAKIKKILIGRTHGARTGWVWAGWRGMVWLGLGQGGLGWARAGWRGMVWLGLGQGGLGWARAGWRGMVWLGLAQGGLGWAWAGWRGIVGLGLVQEGPGWAMAGWVGLAKLGRVSWDLASWEYRVIRLFEG